MTNERITTGAIYGLEQLIDKHGLRGVLEALADICAEKAEHLRANWNDEASARVWLRDKRKIFALAAKVENSGRAGS